MFATSELMHDCQFVLYCCILLPVDHPHLVLQFFDDRNSSINVCITDVDTSMGNRLAYQMIADRIRQRGDYVIDNIDRDHTHRDCNYRMFMNAYRYGTLDSLAVSSMCGNQLIRGSVTKITHDQLYDTFNALGSPHNILRLALQGMF